MHTTWRIVKRRYASSAFDGEGARLYGGRWNSPGTPVVYSSSWPAFSQAGRSNRTYSFLSHFLKTLSRSLILVSSPLDGETVLQVSIVNPLVTYGSTNNERPSSKFPV
jgi:hypothetical protein